jgi:hypothetical protein
MQYTVDLKVFLNYTNTCHLIQEMIYDLSDAIKTPRLERI